LLANELSVTDNHVGAVVGFKISKRGEQVTAKIASSFISFEQAEINLKEVGSQSFEEIKNLGKGIWNTTLSRISVEGGSVDQTRTFYSCLYRTMLFPRKFYELDAKGKVYTIVLIMVKYCLVICLQIMDFGIPSAPCFHSLT
jgi:putative alpha-1,2-mannosidase